MIHIYIYIYTPLLALWSPDCERPKPFQAFGQIFLVKRPSDTWLVKGLVNKKNRVFLYPRLDFRIPSGVIKHGWKIL